MKVQMATVALLIIIEQVMVTASNKNTFWTKKSFNKEDNLQNPFSLIKRIQEETEIMKTKIDLLEKMIQRVKYHLS